jgi:hypothetical protein
MYPINVIICGGTVFYEVYKSATKRLIRYLAGTVALRPTYKVSGFETVLRNLFGLLGYVDVSFIAKNKHPIYGYLYIIGGATVA